MLQLNRFQTHLSTNVKQLMKVSWWNSFQSLVSSFYWGYVWVVLCWSSPYSILGLGLARTLYWQLGVRCIPYWGWERSIFHAEVQSGYSMLGVGVVHIPQWVRNGRFDIHLCVYSMCIILCLSCCHNGSISLPFRIQMSRSFVQGAWRCGCARPCPLTNPLSLLLSWCVW